MRLMYAKKKLLEFTIQLTAKIKVYCIVQGWRTFFGSSAKFIQLRFYKFFTGPK